MKISCQKSLLVETIAIVHRAVPARTTVPILECIRLEAKESFKLLASDMNLIIESKPIEAEIEEEGCVALEAKIFSDIVRNLPDGLVEISSTDKMITTIRCENSVFEIIGQYPQGFPEFYEFDKDKAISMRSQDLKDLIRQTIFSVSPDESKPSMTGELLEIENGMAKMVAVDGFRVAVRKIKLSDEDSLKEFYAVIPGSTLEAVARILQTSASHNIGIVTSNQHILFDTMKYTIASKRILNDFMSFEGVFHNNYTTRVFIKKETLQEAILRATLISRDMKRIRIVISEDDMEISANTQYGHCREKVSVEFAGLPIDISLNPHYLLEIVRAIDEESISLEFTTPLSPVIVQAEDESYKYLLLPHRVKN